MTVNKSSDMTTGNPIKKILMFALPLFIGTMFQQVYNLVDTMIAGHNLGDSAVAAIGATSALYAVIIYFASGLNSGYGIIISRAYGEKNLPKLRKAVATMMVLDGAITAVLTAIVLPVLKMLLRVLDTPLNIFEDAYSYIFIFFAGMIVTIAYNMCAGFLQAVGNSRIPLYFLIVSCVINAGLDWLFIAKLSMGVRGAAYATLIATFVSAASCFICIVLKFKDLLPSKKDFRLEKDLTTEMLSTGLSMALMGSVFAFGSIILQRAINGLGTTLITAHTASRKAYEFLMMPMSTIATATATFVSQNFGAGKTERITSTIKKVMGIELAWSVFSFVVAFFGGSTIIKLMLGTADADVISNGNLNLTVGTLMFFPLAVLLVMRVSMQSMGYKVFPVISSSIELIVKIIAAEIIIPAKGYMAVVFTEPVAWVLCATFLVTVYAITSKKVLNKVNNNNNKLAINKI